MCIWTRSSVFVYNIKVITSTGMKGVCVVFVFLSVCYEVMMCINNINLVGGKKKHQSWRGLPLLHIFFSFFLVFRKLPSKSTFLRILTRKCIFYGFPFYLYPHFSFVFSLRLSRFSFFSTFSFMQRQSPPFYSIHHGNDKIITSISISTFRPISVRHQSMLQI